MVYPPDSLEASVSAAVVAAIKAHEATKADYESRVARWFKLFLFAVVIVTFLVAVFAKHEAKASAAPVVKSHIAHTDAKPIKHRIKRHKKCECECKKVVDTANEVVVKEFIGPRS